MQIAIVGLGKMGANIVKRLLGGGHDVVAYDLNDAAVKEAQEAGATGVSDLQGVVSALDKPRNIWVMVPSGDPTRKTVESLAELMEPGDTIIDGGNSNYKGTITLGKSLAERQLNFVDVGTSGGVWGLEEGYSMMVGGEDGPVNALRSVFETLAPAADKGWGHVGPSGSGHFVKMIHNGIEYGAMQAYAEGFALMKRRDDMGLDVHQIARIWQHGSVIRSWLLDLTADALEQDAELADIAPYVPDSGEGRWTVAEAIEQDLAAPVMTLALLARLRSRDEEGYSDRLLSAMRNQFGGHATKKTS